MTAMVVAVEGWNEFFVAEAGAAAALAGLLFVAMSINVKEIVSYAWLPARAIATVVLLVGALLAASVALLPDLSDANLGLALLVVTGVVWVVPLYLRLRWWGRSSHAPEPRWLPLLLDQAATLPGLVGAVVVTAGNTDGLYLLAVGILVSFVVAVVNAWVLLVEILR